MITEIEAILFAQEERFIRYKLYQSSLFQANITFASSPHHSQSRPTFPNSSCGGRGYNPSSKYNRFNHGKSRPSHYNSWNSTTFSSWKRNNIWCQICSKLGHIVLHCWNWYDCNTPPTFSANTSHLSTPPSDDCSSSLLGTPSSLEDPLWYLNSGASHHITNNHTLFND